MESPLGLLPGDLPNLIGKHIEYAVYSTPCCAPTSFLIETIIGQAGVYDRRGRVAALPALAKELLLLLPAGTFRSSHFERQFIPLSVAT
jgi:hypothetical protein